MLLDTGADISLIPTFIIEQFEEHVKLPYNYLIVEGFDGRRSKCKVYKLELKSEQNAIGTEAKEFLASLE